MKLSETLNTIIEYYRKIIFYIIIFCFVLICLLCIVNPRIDRDVLFWFLSSISQSMAAMFAVIGMFAIFRYESIIENIKRELDVIKYNIASVPAQEIAQRISFKGIVEEGALDNILSELEGEAGKKLKTVARVLHNNLYVSTLICKQNIIVRDNVIKFARIPMVLMIFNFIVSSFSLLIINAYFGKSNSFNMLGEAIILIIVIFIVITLMSIMKFFRISFSNR